MKMPQSVENLFPSETRPELFSEAPSMRKNPVSPYCPKNAAGIPTYSVIHATQFQPLTNPSAGCRVRLM